MNKTDLAVKVAEQTGVPKAYATRVINLIFDEIKTAVVNGDTAQFVGFGTFSAVEKKARTGKNPQTGETIKIAAKRAPKFKAGTDFKTAVAAKKAKKTKK